MRLLHTDGAVRASFDDPNLVSYAGLEPVMRLAESCDLHGTVRERLYVPTDKGANASGKVATIVAGMLTGADSIELTDLPVTQIGRAVGGRDHTTVLHAHRKIRQQMAERHTLSTRSPI